MLRLIETEFYKLRRKKSVWMMVLATFLMPALSVCYFGYLGQAEVEPAQFYKWSAFGYTTWIILPVILGIFATMIVYEEKRLQIVRQIWLVPVKEESYFFSKFCMVLVLSVGFMMLTAVASVLCSVLPGFVPFRLEDMMYLFEKCMEIGILLAFASDHKYGSDPYPKERHSGAACDAGDLCGKGGSLYFRVGHYFLWACKISVVQKKIGG